jgi:hypothetical protein
MLPEADEPSRTGPTATLLYDVSRSGAARGSSIGRRGYVGRLPVDDPQGLRESILEEVRASTFPHLPSRNESVFAWQDRAMAARWLEEHEIGTTAHEHVVYLVEPSAGALTFRGDYGWLALTYSSLDELRERAHRYWSALQRPVYSAWEVLIQGELIVKAQWAPPLGQAARIRASPDRGTERRSE